MIILYKFVSKFLGGPVKILEQLGWPTKATPPKRKTSKYEKTGHDNGKLGKGWDWSWEVECAPSTWKSFDGTQHCGHEYC